MNGKKIMAGALSAAMLLSTASFTAFAEELTQNVENSIQVLAESTITEISSVDDFKEFAQSVADGNTYEGITVTLTADLDFTGENSIAPIGSAEINSDIKSFKGTFNGNGKTISNLTIAGQYNMTGNAYYGNGLFSKLENATVKNVMFDNVNVYGKDSTTFNGNIYAVVAGYSNKTTFENVNVTNSTVTGYGKIGGIAGMGHGNTFDSCSVTETTLNGSHYKGGFIGYADITSEKCDIKGSSYIDNVTFGDIADENDSAKSHGRLTFDTNDYKMAEREYFLWDYTDGNTYSYVEESDFATYCIDNKNDISRTATDGNVYYAQTIPCDAAASLGNDTKKYADINYVLQIAEPTDTIKLLSDVKLGRIIADTNTTFKNSINLNEHTLTLTDPDNHTYGNINFSNGKIVANDLTTHAQGILVVMSGTLTFDNVEFTCNNLKGCAYVIDSQNDKSFKAENSKFFVDGFEGSGAVFGGGAPNSEFDGCEINISNSTTGILHNATLKNTKYNATNLSGEALKIGGNGGWKITLDNSTVNVDGCENGVKLYPNNNLELTNGSTLDVRNATNAGILLNDATAIVTKSEDSTIKADIKTEKIGNAALANTVKVAFEDVTVNEGEKVYDLYVEATADTINRLTSAQLALKLDSEKDFDFVVNGTDKVNVTEQNGMYLFNFNGEKAADATGTKIKLGQIKVTGYGKFSFKATAGEAHATTKEDNIVTDYVINPNDKQGKLDISAELTDVEIKVPTRDLKVNIAFNNGVTAQSAAYTDMTVKVSGHGLTQEAKLADIENNSATVEFKDVLEKDKAYTVEVSGAGYRTARYTVTMTANKELNFWNNVKDNAVNVEVDNDNSKKDVTFLAGELVKDGKINVYDLSAVVSYFGTENNVNAESPYARYDLNRDGKIDSKDVAYVLVSWGK